MKQTLLTLLAVAVFAPYFIGRIQYQNTIIVAQNLTDRTDGEISNVLATFDFDLDWNDQPTTADYYKAGIKAIF